LVQQIVVCMHCMLMRDKKRSSKTILDLHHHAGRSYTVSDRRPVTNNTRSTDVLLKHFMTDRRRLRREMKDKLDDVRVLQQRNKLLQLLDLSSLVDASVELTQRVAQVAEYQLAQATSTTQHISTGLTSSHKSN